MLTLLVSIAMTQGYFLGADIMLYVKLDIILAIIIAVLWIWMKSREKHRKKRS